MWLVYCVHSTTKMILFSENDYAPYRHTNKYWTYQQKISLGLKVQLSQKNATKYFLCLHSVHRFAHKFRIENQPESRWSAPWLQQCQPSHRLPFLFEMEISKNLIWNNIICISWNTNWNRVWPNLIAVKIYAIFKINSRVGVTLNRNCK